MRWREREREKAKEETVVKYIDQEKFCSGNTNKAAKY